MKNEIIAIFGATGFLGNYVTKILLKSGKKVRILSRTPEKALHLKMLSNLGQLELYHMNPYDEQSIIGGLKNVNAIINLVGSRSNNKKDLFTTNVLFPRTLAKLAKKLKVPKLIHFSSIGVENTYESIYAHSKYEGDQYLKQEYKNSVILRPGIMFGQNDNFIHKLYFLMSKMPFFISNNINKIVKPMHAEDISYLLLEILDNYKKYQGHVFNVTGAHAYPLYNIIQALEKGIGKKINVLNLRKSLYTLCTSISSKILPSYFMDKEYVHLLLYDYETHPKNNLKEIQIDSTDLEQFISSKLTEQA